MSNPDMLKEDNLSEAQSESCSKKQLDDLKLQRGNTKGCISRMKNYLTGKADSLTANELECRLGILESYWKLLLSHQTLIEKLSPSDQTNITVRGELEDLYCDVKSKILSLLPNLGRSSICEGNNSFVVPTPPRASLPPLRLPQFSGKYSEYPSFIATFNKLVHDDSSKSITEKYNHLRNCLIGPALRTIDSLGKSAAAYNEALDKHKDRYDNKCLIFQEHITEMFELPKVQKGSACLLRSLIDNVSAHLSALRILGSDTNIVNSIIIHLVNSKLDADSQAKWEESIDYTEFPTWSQCESVLSRRCQFLEVRERKPQVYTGSINFSKNQHSKRSVPQHKNPTALKVTKAVCGFCSESTHSIFQCTKFSELSALDRFEEVKRRALCINCLSKGHSVRDCRMSKCRVCNSPHNTILHRFSRVGSTTQERSLPGLSRNITSNSTNSVPTTSENNIEAVGVVSGISSLCSSHPSTEMKGNKGGHVFLATAMVKIRDRSGSFHFARALLDSASQLNFITADLVHKLRLKRQHINADVTGIGDVSVKVKFETRTLIKSRTNDYETDLHFWILPSITSPQPDVEINISKWNIPKNLELADPHFNTPQPIDILIGAEKFFEFLSIGQIKLSDTLPTLQKTLFGWIIGGKYELSNLAKQVCSFVTNSEMNPEEDDLNKLVENFWKVESVELAAPMLSEEQKSCEKIFLDSIQQLESGNLIVKLPFKRSPDVLGNSFDIARKRFISLERKLDKDTNLKSQYTEFLEEYESLDHMEPLLKKDIPAVHYYMPHHCVLRPQSSTTKLRVVFDASCRSSTNVSLNDILMVGPTVQNDLLSILLRFRMFKFALTADISKMYRQIWVYPEDRNVQYILWRNDAESELQTYRLKTITYGTASAPYLATRCLNYLADMNKDKFPTAATIIKEDFYVDDLLTGANTFEELQRVKTQVQTVLSSAGLELRKWYSNNSEMLREIPDNNREKTLQVKDANIIKTLGIAWKAEADEFVFTFEDCKDKDKITKRIVLSETAKLFDPLGLVNPIVVRAKMFMQELWLLKLSWDESLPQELYSRWKGFQEDLRLLNTIRIPRHVLTMNEVANIQIHGFADASIRAYGCCIYTRSEDKFGNIAVRLLTAKSKVAPTKPMRSLPCLELCGAELLTKVLIKVCSSLRTHLNKIFLWTDSGIVLGWIASHPSRWQTFVGNRVSKIQELAPTAVWRHVPTKMNPADIISRGVTVDELKDSCWFSGPNFLNSPLECWPEKKIQLKDLPEARKPKSVLVCLIEQSFLDKIYKFSSFSKARRIFAYVLRFIDATRKGRSSSTQMTDLSAEELEKSFQKIIWLIQQREFKEEIRALENSEMISPKSYLCTLNPFLDNLSLLRVGGRLQNADIPYNAKCPILLPKNNPFIQSYVKYLHINNFHAGPQALIALIRQKFWIVNARTYARKIVRSCLQCFLYRPRLLQQIMGHLPTDRVSPSKAFANVGIDFCGPMMTTYNIRGKRPYKTYIAVFVCFWSRGVHLEVVSDLSAEAFIAALKRFVGRRGLCKHIHCDNATNFVGGRRLLAELREKFLNQNTQSEISKWCAEQGIEFRHIPPRSPHFGGIWEAAVKSAKSDLFKTFQHATLTFEELCTVCCQIEAILNSRPICQLSSDPNDEQALTPAHFWNQAPLNCFVEPDITKVNMSYLSRWRRISQLQQHFWSRWSLEYLSSLHTRYKWKISSPNVAEGTMVLVHVDNLPPQKWMLGKIAKTYTGPDGNVRVVDVQTKAGIVRRVIQKIAPLPTDEEDCQR